MAQVNPLTRELLVKLVYYGPGLGGKTTSLQSIHASSPPETRGQIVSLATPVDRTLYFDFLPLRLPPVRNLHVRLQLFTVPGQVYFNATRKLVLTGADGVVFVADSQRERHDANLESLQNLDQNLEEQGRDLRDLPMVLQYNKRDLPNILGIDELDRQLNPRGLPSFATCATEGEGVVDALDHLVHLVLEDVSRRHDLGEEPEPSAEPTFGRAEDALEEQIGRASEQIWRSTLQRALTATQSRPPEGGPVSSAPSQPPPGTSSAPASAPSVPAPATIPAPAGTKSYPPVAAAGEGPSWRALFPEDPQRVGAVERHLSAGAHAEAIRACAELADAILDRVADRAGLTEGGPVVVGLLGVSGERYLAFRHLVRRARAGGPLDEADALRAFATVIDLRLAEARASR